MNRKNLTNVAVRVAYLVCDVAVAASGSFANGVAAVAGAIMQNLAPDDQAAVPEASAQPQLPVGDLASMPPGLRQALASIGVVPLAPAPLPPMPGPTPPAPLWLPAQTRELRQGDLAKFNGRACVVETPPRHEVEESCHGEPITLVHLHLRDLVTGEEDVVATTATLMLLAERRAPDYITDIVGPGTAGAAS